MISFRKVLKKARNILVLTGAGVSAESGVPTFRGAGGLWRTYQAPNLATPEAFAANPSLVWEFYHYRRELVLGVHPNKAHEAIAAFESHMTKQGVTVTIVTQNIDGLHQRAGSKNVVELHGSLYKTRCTVCKEVAEDRNSPICPALEGKGAPDPEIKSLPIPVQELPRCKKAKCKGLLRPHIVWFGENLEKVVLQRAEEAVETCDICLIVGTSSVVYPAAMFAPQVANRGVPVAEFNIETTPATDKFESVVYENLLHFFLSCPSRNTCYCKV
ncbi:NAD-dependent protein deacylase sirtuin-5, mitochondrial-like [Athalia rosae]|uniref:NAD-dependent protein deacylase sirtuin-5, mitochondrial-like n=1 Tax=Athalia rosae TaxID=37344 RepID=UPI00203442CA|nr:NAD-dependent protein deacylase sirtuin-5, mitochondrial-like [Athalia rosae]